MRSPVDTTAAVPVPLSTLEEETGLPDKTVRRVKNPVGSIKRLSAAVVVNHRRIAGPKPAYQALSAEEMAQISALAKEAMGYSQDRGDSISVANAPFSIEEHEPVPEVPLWKEPENIALALDAGRILLGVLVVAYILLGLVRPLLRSLAEAPRYEPAPEALPHAEGAGGEHTQRLASARQLAKADPKVVANVVKTWVSADE